MENKYEPDTQRRNGIRIMDRLAKFGSYRPYFYEYGGMIICEDDSKCRHIFDTKNFVSVVTELLEGESSKALPKRDVRDFLRGVTTLEGRFSAGGWVTTDNFVFQAWRSGNLRFSQNHIYKSGAAHRNIQGFLKAWAYNTSVLVEGVPTVGSSKGEHSIWLRKVKERGPFRRLLNLDAVVLDSVSLLNSRIVELAGNGDTFRIRLNSGEGMDFDENGWSLSPDAPEG